MRFVIFAGGSGKRLWPISRENSPKQFEPVVSDKSTLQLAVDRVLQRHAPEDIVIATNERYRDIIRAQVPRVPVENLIGEPARRDLGPAVGLAMTHLRHQGAGSEPVAILWSDNYIENVAKFLDLLAAAETLIRDDAADILFLGETPRFANENLGWIELGERVDVIDDMPYYQFGSLVYRPPLERCREMYAAKTHVWNTGFFLTTPNYVLGLYERHMPEMYQQLDHIGATIGTPDHRATLSSVYPDLESVNFDDAILSHVDKGRALVLYSDMGWRDPGTLYALKEFIQPDTNLNVTKGKVIDTASTDSLIYNYQEDALLVAVGLEGMIVVNTGDAILVVHKDNIPLVKAVIGDLKGTELESFS